MRISVPRSGSSVVTPIASAFFENQAEKRKMGGEGEGAREFMMKFCGEAM
jgi:hypothetical protein